MTYPFVAAPDHWPRNGVPVLAIAIHMAEGGGTVSWLMRPDGNSSHYVVERTGRVVQMVQEDRAAGSIDPTKVRTTDDAPFTFEGEVVIYGVTANKAGLGEHWRNPNAAVIAIEVEGFARYGPNAAQRPALKALVADIRTRHPGIPALGHRDWQAYKACPGKRIPWADYGGHGLSTEEEMGLKVTAEGLVQSGILRTTVASDAIALHDRSRDPLPAGAVRQALAVFLRDFDQAPGYVITEGGVPSWASATAGTFTPDAPSDCADAIKADRAKARILYPI